VKGACHGQLFFPLAWFPELARLPAPLACAVVGGDRGDGREAEERTIAVTAARSQEQARYEEAEKLLLETVEGRRLKLGDAHPHTLESWHNLIELYEAWGKPEEAEKWRAKLPQKEAMVQ